jgi:hypothetical protein
LHQGNVPESVAVNSKFVPLEESQMDPAYISAFFGMVGMTVGGLMSFSTSWMTQQAQLREKRREVQKTQREQIFNEFIAEASRLYGDALSHQKDDVGDLVQLYALVAKMRLIASRSVITAAEEVMDAIIEAYMAPNRSLREIRNMAQSGEMNFLVNFGEACRKELADTDLSPTSPRLLGA